MKPKKTKQKPAKKQEPKKAKLIKAAASSVDPASIQKIENASEKDFNLAVQSLVAPIVETIMKRLEKKRPGFSPKSPSFRPRGR